MTQPTYILPTYRKAPPGSPPKPKKPARTDRRWVRVVSLLLLLLLGGYALARYYGPRRQLAKVQQLREQLLSEAARELPPEARRELWDRYRRESEKLTPEQRMKLAVERESRSQARINKFFELPPREQTAYLDGEIRRLEADRQRWQQQRRANPAGNANAGGPPRPPGPPGGERRRANPEEREKQRKQWLELSSPVDRARRAEYGRLLAARRQALGLPTRSGRGRG